ncbi:beta-glucanase [Streptococcus anginosus]|uniref:beta-glucanase n=1 Tax=Streptococcus anginosus TaxID=1328 RepID=UPI0034A5D451
MKSLTMKNKLTHYETKFEQYEASHMELRNGANGDMFNCIWKPENVIFKDGLMSLKIDSDGQGGYTGGEWRTRDYFSYGFYQVSMKPIKNPGVITSFFTYTGPSDETKWDEIDIEFLGKDTTKVQFNYFTDGKGGHEYLFDLGYDASESFHTYGFDWQEANITWYVDGKAVYTVTENIPETPGKIMMNAWPGIGVDTWLDAYNGQTPLYGYYNWITYDEAKEIK